MNQNVKQKVRALGDKTLCSLSKSSLLREAAHFHCFCFQTVLHISILNIFNGSNGEMAENNTPVVANFEFI